jgi:hypothetical protein
LLHLIFQRTGRTPDEVMGKPPGVRAFLLASMRHQIDEENEAAEEREREAARNRS